MFLIKDTPPRRRKDSHLLAGEEVRITTVRPDPSHPHSTTLKLITPSFARQATIKVMRELGECIWTAPDHARARYSDLVLN